MRRSSALGRIGLPATLLLSACWSLTTDLDLADGSGVAGSGNGSSSSSSSGGTTDAGANGAVVLADDATADGAGSDAARADATADGAPLPLCQGLGVSARLCDDFDVGALAAKWTRIDVSPEVGSVSLGTALFKSTPNAFVARLAGTCPTGTFAQLIDVAPSKPSETTIDFDFSLAPMGTTPSLNIAGISYLVGPAPGFYRIDVSYLDGHLALFQNGPGGFAILEESSTPFPFDAFKHVSISFTFVGSPRAIAKVDGVVHLDKPIAAPAPSVAETAFDFGIYAGQACTAPIEARFDNLVYRLTPP